MKQLAICLCSFLFYSPLFSQDWQLINPAYHYHYVIQFADGSVSDSLSALSIWADSTQGDTSWLNSTSDLHELTEGEVLLNPFRFYQLNRPHFLQQKYVQHADGVQSSWDPDTLNIFPIGTKLPWTLDPQMDIQVLSDSLYENISYRQPDSIRQLLLNSGDTVILSKNFGLLQYPYSYGDTAYYRQIGVKGPQVGFTFPSLKEILSFSIGDKFEYQTLNYYLQDISNPAATQVEASMIQQIEIVDSVHLANGIAYQIRNYKIVERGNCNWGGLYLSCKEIEQGPNPDSANNYSPELQECGTTLWDTLYFSWDQQLAYPDLPEFYEFTSILGPQKPILPHIQIGKGYPREVNYFSQMASLPPPSDTLSPSLQYSLAPISYGTHPSGNLQGRISWRNCELEAGPLPDSVQCLSTYNPDRLSWIIEGVWSKGLGFTHVRWEKNLGAYSLEYVSRELTAYQTQKHSSGTLSPQVIFCAPPLSDPDPMPLGSGALYPNPTNSSFNLHPDLLSRAKSLSIFDGMGRQVYHVKEVPSAGSGISVSSLQPGMYFIRLERDHKEDPLWIQLLVAP